MTTYQKQQITNIVIQNPNDEFVIYGGTTIDGQIVNGQDLLTFIVTQ